MAAARHRRHEIGDLLLKGALLGVGHRRTLVEGDFGDDVLLAEAARIDAGHGHGVPGCEGAQQVVDDGPGLVEFLGIGARGVHQHVYPFGVVQLLSATAGNHYDRKQSGSDHRTWVQSADFLHGAASSNRVMDLFFVTDRSFSVFGILGEAAIFRRISASSHRAGKMIRSYTLTTSRPR